MKCRRRSAALVALTAAAVVASSPGAWAADVRGSLVKLTKTSEWAIPSPDPSGIGYNENSKRFLISDGEVEEMAIYKGVNLYDADTGGELVGTAVTLPWSAEPTGIAVNPNNGEIYVSDDDQRSVFVLESLSDETPGVIGKAKFTAHGVDPDLEGVGYDSKRNEILLANGERGAGFWRVKPGADGKFGTTDDVVMPKILIEAHGGLDPEGIAYDAVRDTVIMVDGSANKIFEMNENGALLNRIDISGLGMDAPAGIEVAPASNGSGARNYYIVDRGVDNNSDPNENDGVLYEVSAQLGDAGANQPPTANAGSDQVTTVGGTVTLNGSATDIETPSAELDYSWTRQTGPLGVTFGTPNAATTTATFTEAGTYQLRLTVKDSAGLADFDDVTITVADAGSVVSVSRPILASSDDAMEGSATGGTFVDIGSKQNALGNRETGAGVLYPVTTGLRFGNVPVPKGGQIVSASIQFKVDVATSGTASFVIKGQAADDAPTFGGSGNITSRTTTTASVPWSPADWTVVNATGPDQRTPDLAAILQEIVDRPGWAANNAVALTISGTGRRAAKAWDAGEIHAPVLLIEYKAGGETPPPANTAPTVKAGDDQTVTTSALPATADLKGTVTDDGKTLSSEWTKVSGPGEVTFADKTAAATKATFTKAGEYVLRLTGNDGALTASDDVKVTVKVSTGGGGSTPPPTTPTPPPTTPTPPPTTPTPPPAEVETEVTLQGEYRAIPHAGTVRLSGTVAKDGKGAAGATVELYVSRAGGDRELLGSQVTGSDGGFSFSDRPEVNSVYVAVSAETSSQTVRVLVRPRIAANLRHGSVLAGTRTAIVGFVSPAADGHLLRLQRWDGGRWRTTQTKSLADGGDKVRFRFVVRVKASGLHRYRVVSPPQAGRARVVAGGQHLRLRVYKATVKRVNHRADVIVVRNNGRIPFSLEGWMLVERRSGLRVGLPDFTVRPGKIVRIHSGGGTDDRRNLHLGTGEMWAAHGVAELRDARLRLADRLRF